jgi:hypothetical protein
VLALHPASRKYRGQTPGSTLPELVQGASGDSCGQARDPRSRHKGGLKEERRSPIASSTATVEKPTRGSGAAADGGVGNDQVGVVEHVFPLHDPQRRSWWPPIRFYLTYLG